MLSRDDQDVGRRLRVDVGVRHAKIVLVDDFRGDFPVNDRTKQTISHEQPPKKEFSYGLSGGKRYSSKLAGLSTAL
jgi:hypothetical protein